MPKDSTIYVAGHRGLVGSSIMRELKKRGFEKLLVRTRRELDLRHPHQVQKWFESHSIDYVINAAAKAGGILANDTYPATFIYDNLMIQTNLIHFAQKFKVKKFVFLGSSCIYPKLAPQPIKEEYLLTGKLEKTNKAYAVAKIAGIATCQAYHRQYGFNAVSLMPTNIYGPNDNFDLESSHVIPALIRKFYDAKTKNTPSVTIWGTGAPKREFLYVDDLARATVFLLETYDDPDIINVGTGKDISIKELALLIKAVVDYDGEITYDTNKPDGTPRKLLDTSKITNLGWKPKYSLKKGLRMTFEWFENHYSSFISQ
ncbi:MAG: GDP-L-fucose synthase family protein [Candidatus Thorarchaeota archaeon]